MDMTQALDRIRAAGVQLRARAGKIEHSGDLTPRQIAWLAQHEAELVALLSPGPAEPERIPWTEMADVITVVEDLFRERWHPDKIARTLGLTRAEIMTILRRPGDPLELQPSAECDVAKSGSHARRSGDDE